MLGMKILLIDDNEQITKMLNTFLRLEGHDCVIVNEGRVGLSLIEEQKFDVILLDLEMPEFTGYDIIDSLEEKGTIKEHKIILFTASNVSKAELDSFTRRGIKSYLLKPANLDELLEKLKAVAKS